MANTTYEELQKRRDQALDNIESALDSIRPNRVQQQAQLRARAERAVRRRLAEQNWHAQMRQTADKVDEQTEPVGIIHADGSVTPTNSDGSPAADDESVSAVDAALQGREEGRFLSPTGDTFGPEFNEAGGQPTQSQLGLAGISVDAAGMEELGDTTRPFRYTEDSTEQILAGLGPVRTARLKQQLLRAGLISEADAAASLRNSRVNKAFRQVLGHANVSGLDWETALADAEQQGLASGAARTSGGAGGAERAGFVAEGYVAPDYDTLAQEVKNFASSRLDGRNLEDWEVKLLAERLGGFHREGYDANLERERQTFEARQQAAETGEDVTTEGGQEVDPRASFREYFEEKYAPEIAVEEQEAEGQATAARFMRSIQTVDRNV